MPTYVFICDKEKGGCNNSWELLATMVEAPSLKPKCPKCQKNKCVHRHYIAEVPMIDAGSITLGSLADKNADKYSDDYKAHLVKKHTEYKTKIPDTPLPAGLKYGKQVLKEEENA